MGRGNGDLWKEKVGFLKGKSGEEKVGIEGSFRVVWFGQEQPCKPDIIVFSPESVAEPNHPLSSIHVFM